MASPYLYRLQSRSRLFAKGHLWLTEGSFRQTGRNLDIRLGSCEGITDPWPTPSAAVRRSAPGQARAAVPPDPLRCVYGHPLTRHGATPVGHVTLRQRPGVTSNAPGA